MADKPLREWLQINELVDSLDATSSSFRLLFQTTLEPSRDEEERVSMWITEIKQETFQYVRLNDPTEHQAPIEALDFPLVAASREELASQLKLGLVGLKEDEDFVMITHLAVFVNIDSAREWWDRYSTIPCASDILSLFSAFAAHSYAGLTPVSRPPLKHMAHFERRLRTKPPESYAGLPSMKMAQLDGTDIIIDASRRRIVSSADLPTPEFPSCHGGVIVGGTTTAAFRYALTGASLKAHSLPKAPFSSSSTLLIVHPHAAAWYLHCLHLARPKATVLTIMTKADLNRATWASFSTVDYVVTTSAFLQNKSYVAHMHTVLQHVTQQPYRIEAMATVLHDYLSDEPTQSVSYVDTGFDDSEDESDRKTRKRPLTRKRARRLGVKVTMPRSDVLEACAFFDTDRGSGELSGSIPGRTLKQTCYLADTARKILSPYFCYLKKCPRPVFELFTFRSILLPSIDSHSPTFPSRVKLLPQSSIWMTCSKLLSTVEQNLRLWSPIFPEDIDILKNPFSKFSYLIKNIIHHAEEHIPTFTEVKDTIPRSRREEALFISLDGQGYVPRLSQALCTKPEIEHVRFVSRELLAGEVLAFAQLPLVKLIMERQSLLEQLAILDEDERKDDEEDEVEEKDDDDDDDEAGDFAAGVVQTVVQHIIEGGRDTAQWVPVSPGSEDIFAEERDFIPVSPGSRDSGGNWSGADWIDESDQNYIVFSAYSPGMIKKDIEQMDEKIAAIQEKEESLIRRIRGTVDDVLEKQECPSCYDATCDSVLECGHAFCLACATSWYVEHSSCPLCLVEQKARAIIALDTIKTIPGCPDAFEDYSELWKKVLLGTLSTLAFWYVARLDMIEAQGNLAVILTSTTREAKELTSVLNALRGTGGEVTTEDDQTVKAVLAYDAKRPVIRSSISSFPCRNKTMTLFHEGQAHVVMALSDALSGSSLENVTSIIFHAPETIEDFARHRDKVIASFAEVGSEDICTYTLSRVRLLL